jgi:phosphoglycerate dehydrogenase-like enzyme
VCLPNTTANANFINAPLLAAMKPSAMLLSIADGPVLDESALYTALYSRSIGGALIDSWWNFHWQTNGGCVCTCSRLCATYPLTHTHAPTLTHTQFTHATSTL